MNITYLFHSGFLLENNGDYIVIDYFKDNCKKQNLKDCGQICSKTFENANKITFFVSHSHYDHFDKDIFNLNDKACYVISDDVNVCPNNKIKMCSKNQEFSFNNLSIKTFGSTDEGISFLIEFGGKKIFHAGDLNWWHWSGETEEEKNFAEKFFMSEMDNIISSIKPGEIDIAFFPVDPRQEEFFYLGGKYFIEKLMPKNFVPMHFQDNYYITDKFYKLMNNTNTNVHRISKRGERINIL